jgi:signal transduction histidine kinase
VWPMLSGVTWLIVLGASLAWFAALVVRGIRSARRSGTPAWPLLRPLVLNVVALPLLVWMGGLPVWASVFMVGLALVLWRFAPGYVHAKLAPLTMVAVGLNGLVVARDLARGLDQMRPYGLIRVESYSADARLVLPQAFVFLIAGAWLTWRTMDQDSLVSKWILHAAPRRHGESGHPRWGLLLLPVFGLLVEMLGRTYWLGTAWWSVGVTAAVGLAAVALVTWLPVVAADLTIACLTLFGLYGVALAAGWPYRIPLPSPYTLDVRYGAVWVASRTSAFLAGAEGLAFVALALWLVPRALDDRTRALLRSATDAELAQRVGRLTRSRAEVVDTAATQLRQLERDLHDGAQARLVALGISLRAAERLIPISPDAAVALVAEARETSVKVLDELRDLVRGIHPPVLADRGLADAVRALALDTPMRTEVDIDLPGRLAQPVETACYFAVAEALTNAVKHSGARCVHIRISYEDATLRITVSDDGVGGADPQRGSGLLGLERRLGAFDGVLAVSSPPGGPSIVAIEVPCSLVTQKRVGVVARA